MNPLQAWGGGVWTVSKSNTGYFHSGVTSSEEMFFSYFSSFCMGIVRIIRQLFYFCFRRWWDCWCFLYWWVLVVCLTGKGGITALLLFSVICHETMVHNSFYVISSVFPFEIWIFIVARILIARLAISASLIKCQHCSNIGKAPFCMLIKGVH